MTSRTTSTHSTSNSTSNIDNINSEHTSNQLRRRIRHIAAEQKRRQSIKHGYDLLKQQVISSENQFDDKKIKIRITKHLILQKAIERITSIVKQKRELASQQSHLQRDLTSLGMIDKAYTNMQIALKPRDRMIIPSNRWNIDKDMEHQYVDIFYKLLSHLFSSFERHLVNSSPLNTISAGDVSFMLLRWVESECCPNRIEEALAWSCSEFYS